MSGIRKRIEKGFESLGKLISAHPVLVLALCLIPASFFATQMRFLEIDTSNEGFLHPNDPVLKTYDEFRDRFGRDEMIAVAIRSRNIFSEDTLLSLKALHEELEDKVPYLDDITSLINARDTRGKGDELIVEDLLKDWPDEPRDLLMVKKRALENPLYQNALLSMDGTFTTILIKTLAFKDEEAADVLEGFDDSEAPKGLPEPRRYLTPEENGEIMAAIKEITQKYNTGDFSVYIAGSPVFMDALKRMMQRDMPRFVLMSIVVIALFLTALFRKPGGVFLPLVTVIISLISTLGFMAFLGMAIKLPTQILPSFILAVGVGDSVHILAIYYRRLAKGDDKTGALIHTLGHSGLPVVLTSLTTAGGLISFYGADLAPISDLGLASAAGVLMAMGYSLTLLPAMLALLGAKGRKAASRGSFGDRFLLKIADFSTKRAGLILVITALLLVMGISGIAQLKFSHNVLKWLPQTLPERRDTELIDRELRGSVTMEIVVDTGRENGLYDGEFLTNLDTLAKEVEKIEQENIFVGKVQSVADIIKEIHKALNENRKEFYAIPLEQKLIAQEFLLFENSGSDDLEDFVDSQFSKARFMIKTPMIDATAYALFIERVEALFEKGLGPGATFTSTGMITILSRIVVSVITSMVRSYLIALGVITMLMILLIGKLRIGLASMIPNLFPIIICLGGMGWLGIPLDNFTILVGSIAMGIAVDDTIHFMHNFRRYYNHSGNTRKAVQRTLTTAGRAMLFTTMVLSTGFFIYMFASLSNMILFGLITGTALIMALLADFFIAPALMVAINRD